MPTRLLIAAAALVVLPGVATSQTLVGRADQTYTWRGPLRAPSRLSVRNFNGPIDVRAATGDMVELRAEKRVGRGRGAITDVAFDVRTAGNGDVAICSTLRDRDPCDEDHGRSRRDDGDDYDLDLSVAMTILVPRGAQLNVVTGNGAVSIENVGGEVRAVTGNGRVRVAGTDGPIRVVTGNGAVDVRDARAPVHVSTGNGSVTVATTSGPVEAHSGNGDIDVRMSALSSKEAMTFSTGSGSVRLTLPAGYSGDLDASTGSGRIDSDFDLKVRDGRLDRHRIHATIGDGGPLLRLSTGSGRVEIRKGQ